MTSSEPAEVGRPREDRTPALHIYDDEPPTGAARARTPVAIADATESGRTPSDAAQQSVLGGLMLGADWASLAGVIHSDDYAGKHRLIIEAIASLAAQGERYDTVMVSTQLARAGHLAAAGGLAYLSELARNTPSAENVATYARAVRDRAVRRKVLEAADSRVDTGDLIEQLEQHIVELRQIAPPGSAPGATRFDPERARVSQALLDERPDPVEVIVREILRRTAGVRASAGGTGKSTLTLYEMVCIILGADLYGREVMRPGPCVLLTAEDERQHVEYRLWRIMEDLKLSRPDREQVLGHLHIEDLTGSPCRFVDVGENSSLVHTPAVREFIERYRDIAPSLISIDPMLFFGPGERFVNDGEGELMRAGRRIAGGLNAAVRFEHHTGKGQARDRSIDQYAGRGGSAGADNARFVHVLQVHEAEDKLAAPKRCTAEDIAKGNVLRLHVAKDSYGVRPAAPIWILRTGFLFTHVLPDPVDDADPMQERLRKLFGFIEAEENSGVRHTANTLDSRLREIGLSRLELRGALHVALERKHLLEQDLPKAEQQGRKKTYLARGLRP